MSRVRFLNNGRTKLLGFPRNRGKNLFDPLWAHLLWGGDRTVAEKFCPAVSAPPAGVGDSCFKNASASKITFQLFRRSVGDGSARSPFEDLKSTRLNSSHSSISYAVF